jgi:hypothetical protein
LEYVENPLLPFRLRIIRGDHPLASAWAKFNRAGVHLAGVAELEARHLPLTSDGHGVELVRRTASTADVIVRLAPVPLDVACVVGDAVHCLRSALDHGAWALSRRAGYVGPAQDVYFPVCETPAAFEKKRKAIANVVGEDAIGAVEALQPFRGQRAVSWLHRLDIIDKHRAIAVVNHRCVVNGIRLWVSGREIQMVQTPGRPEAQDVQDGDTITTLSHDGPLSGVQVKIDLGHQFAIAADTKWPTMSLETLMRDAFNEVEEGLQRLQDVMGA